MATIVKRGTSRRAQVCVDGERKSATIDSKARAREWALEMGIKLNAGDDQERLAFTVSDALDHYATSDVSPSKKGAR